MSLKMRYLQTVIGHTENRKIAFFAFDDVVATLWPGFQSLSEPIVTVSAIWHVLKPTGFRW